MAETQNLQLNEIDGDESLVPAEARPQNAKELEAVYDIPVQISGVRGRATMQVSQLV